MSRAPVGMSQACSSRRLFLFDITYGGSVNDLKKALSSVYVHHYFKVIGENRYYFVAQSYVVEDLRKLQFPEGSAVTQYPMQHYYDFSNEFGTPLDRQDRTVKFDDDVLTMTFWDVIPGNPSSGVYQDIMRTFVQQLASIYAKVTHETYATLASYPPRVFSVSDFDPSYLKDGIEAILNASGGFDHSRISTKYITMV